LRRLLEERKTTYTPGNFTVKPIGPNAVVVSYIVQYEGKSGGRVSKGKKTLWRGLNSSGTSMQRSLHATNTREAKVSF